MNKVIKTAAVAVAGLAIAGSTIATPLSASAWWRNTGDYSTLRLVDCDENGDNCQMKKCDENGNNCSADYVDTGDTPIFNTIINNPNYGDERNFVSATTPDNIHGTWNAGDIVAQDGQEYVVRIYMHNNNQYGQASNETKGTATSVRAAFSLPDVYGTAIEVGGWINSGNAKDTQIYDDVVFKSVDGRPFRLEYVAGSANLQNNGFAGQSGATITDPAIVTSETTNVKTGALIGYHGFDGNVPGCFEYDQIITIKVKAVYTDFVIDKKVRVEGGKWSQTVEAKVGDTVEFRIKYANVDENKDMHERVVIRDVLPQGLSYVAGTTTLKNANHPDGIVVTPDGQLFTDGIEIGSYAYDTEAAVYFKAVVVDDGLECGKNTLVNWGQGRVADRSIQDYAGVYTTKVCETVVTELPEAGPVVTLGGAVVTGTVVTAAGYFIMSRRALRR